MSQERSFTDRVKYFKQQAENQRQSDLVTRQQQQQQDPERQKQEEVRRQQEIQETIRRTKENFAGTGILEIFQEIIDKQILYLTDIKEKTTTTNFFRGGFRTNETKRKIPAMFTYHDNAVRLNFGLFTYEVPMSCDTFMGEFANCYLEVKKDESTKFSLGINNYDGCSSKNSRYSIVKDSLDVDALIDEMAKVIGEGLDSNPQQKEITINADKGYNLYIQHLNEQRGIFEK